MDTKFVELYNKYFNREADLDNEIASWKKEANACTNVEDFTSYEYEIEDLIAVKRALDFHGGTF